MAPSPIPFTEVILRYRWLVAAFISIFVFLIEMVEHSGRVISIEGFWWEAGLFGVGVPLTYGLLLTMIHYSRTEKNEAQFTLDQHVWLSQALSRSHNLETVIQAIVQFPRSVVPVNGTSLRVLNPTTEHYELVDYWFDSPVQKIEQLQDLSQELCAVCSSTALRQNPYLIPCPAGSQVNQGGSLNQYCLPLAHKGKTVAVLHLYFRDLPVVLPRQARLFFDTAPEMAMALETARMQQLASNEIEATNLERRRIARDLHDTLGQNISYLRLKLDQITGEDALKEISVIRKELEHMRDVADVAYLQVRTTLADLQPESHKDLADGMRELLMQVAGRAAFEPVFAVRGQPRPLASQERRQLLFIFREILNNIEKHAHAGRVEVLITWSADGLHIEVHDNGNGFQIHDGSLAGHYGLQIMNERAAEIGAALEIESIPYEGTSILLRLGTGHSHLLHPVILEQSSNAPIPTP
jgi:signal transduction histidine kinase